MLSFEKELNKATIVLECLEKKNSEQSLPSTSTSKKSLISRKTQMESFDWKTIPNRHDPKHKELNEIDVRIDLSRAVAVS